MTLARVMLWGRPIGAVFWDADRSVGVFQYTEAFAATGIQVAPLTMPLNTEPYVFRGLDESFQGLPGLLADSLPGRFGTRVFDAWLGAAGRRPGSLNPVERLCHIGRHGMGALEFEPATGPLLTKGRAVDIEALCRTASQLETNPVEAPLPELEDLVQVAVAAGGARPKALVAWNRETGEFHTDGGGRSAKGESWLLKFDGRASGELRDAGGSGPVEYAYALMARDAGIEMAPCRLLEAGDGRHFMTRRFDRTDRSRKLHMQSLAALCHFDFNDSGGYSYEQAVQAIRRVSSAAQADCEQLFLRAVFNVATCNQDDHAKNIAFLMWPNGQWRLSPAFDLTYAHDPTCVGGGGHQMSVNGKRDNISHDDLLALACVAGLKPARAKALVRQVLDCVRRWPEFTEYTQISPLAPRVSLQNSLRG